MNEYAIAALSVAAGLGWGVAAGLAVALRVALQGYERPDPGGGEEMSARRAEVRAFPDFGEKRA